MLDSWQTLYASRVECRSDARSKETQRSRTARDAELRIDRGVIEIDRVSRRRASQHSVGTKTLRSPSACTLLPVTALTRGGCVAAQCAMSSELDQGPHAQRLRRAAQGGLLEALCVPACSLVPRIAATLRAG